MPAPTPPEPSFSDRHGGELVTATGGILFLMWGNWVMALVCLALFILFAVASLWPTQKRTAPQRPGATGTTLVKAPQAPETSAAARAMNEAARRRAAAVEERAKRNATYLPPWRAIFFCFLLLLVFVVPFWGK